MLKGYRTVIVAFLAALIPVLQQADIVALVPEGWELVYAMGIAALMTYMRSITSTSLFKSE